MKQPKDWYGFKIYCKLYESGCSNMSPPSKQQYCKRKGEDINSWMSCNWNVCPKLKKLRKRLKDESKLNEIIELEKETP